MKREKYIMQSINNLERISLLKRTQTFLDP